MNIETHILAAKPMDALRFDPLDFFEGDVRCEGFIADRSSNIRRSFVINFHGVRVNDILKVSEIMYFHDGEVMERHWEFRNIGAAHWHATANDISGIIDIVQGATPRETRWIYRMPLRIKNRDISFSFEDIMTQTSPTRMSAMTNIRKFGFKVAQIITSYSKI
jgi:Protein of unknown function (DUF3833)